MILNLTQHVATADQIAAGVMDLDPVTRATVAALLTFDDIPTRQEIADRADDLAAIAAIGDEPTDDETDAMRYDRVMIGGAPWLMAALEAALRVNGLTPVYAFSRRESVDISQLDGTVRKTAVFRHVGWVDA